MDENIILIGMPFAGKSSTGKCLSKILKKHYFDTDEYIEYMEKMTISEFFSTYGETEFRLKERSIIKVIEKTRNFVVATGGGLPVFYNNMDRLIACGITVFIDVPIDILLQRAKSHNNRPLLLENVEKNMNMIYNVRLECYHRAKLVIKYENEDVNSLAKKIMRNINCI